MAEANVGAVSVSQHMSRVHRFLLSASKGHPPQISHIQGGFGLMNGGDDPGSSPEGDIFQEK